MTTEAPTRAVILSAVRAFVTNVKERQREYWSWGAPPGESWREALKDELLALERAAQAEGEPEGGSQKEET